MPSEATRLLSAAEAGDVLAAETLLQQLVRQRVDRPDRRDGTLPDRP